MLSVDLYAENDLSIRERLDMDSLAVISHNLPSPSPSAIPLPTTLGVGQRMDSVLSAAQTPWDFYVHPVSHFTVLVRCDF